MSLVAYPNFLKKFANFTNSKCTELKIQRTQKRSREEKKNTDYIQINDLKNRIKSIKVKKKFQHPTKCQTKQNLKDFTPTETLTKLPSLSSLLCGKKKSQKNGKY